MKNRIIFRYVKQYFTLLVVPECSVIFREKLNVKVIISQTESGLNADVLYKPELRPHPGTLPKHSLWDAILQRVH